MELPVRYASRAILITPVDEVLLMRMAFPWDTEHIWILPGGGIETNESAIQACRRELWEETGLANAPNLYHVWNREFYVEKAGVHLNQQYFWCEVEKFDPHPQALSSDENDAFIEFRWWNLGQLLETNAYVEPEPLVTGIKHIRATGIPMAPYAIDSLGK